MAKRSLTNAEVLTLLAQTPERIVELTATSEEAQLHAAPTHGEWSPHEVLAHLRACADVWGGCITAILNQDHPTLRAVNPTRWITSTDYRKHDFHSSLQAFISQRAELLTILKSLAPEDWARSATVIGAGKPLERTVHLYARRLALHEPSHVKQIARIVNGSA